MVRMCSPLTPDRLACQTNVVPPVMRSDPAGDAHG
jgi:hypothetical protein